MLGYSQDTLTSKTVNIITYDVPPIFPGCEKKKEDKLEKCLNEKILSHINVYFRYPSEAAKKGIEGKVFVSFIIDKEGWVKISNVRGPNPLLEKEAVRIISLLPQMTPAMYNGMPIATPFSIPITFKLEKKPVTPQDGQNRQFRNY
jgi:TonB family protein